MTHRCWRRAVWLACSDLHHGEQSRGNDDLHRRSRERHPQLLPRVVGHPLEARHAAHGQ